MIVTWNSRDKGTYVQPVSEERQYFIYQANLNWLYEDPDRKPTERCKPNEQGLWHNGMGMTVPSKVELSRDQLTEKINERWKGMDNKGRNAVNTTADVRLGKKAEWWLTWFQHETFDVGQDNRRALRSFEDYICWVMSLPTNEYGDPPFTLMGAEDHWRWHGAEPDGEPETRSDPPCRCKHCKELGLIRIAH